MGMWTMVGERCVTFLFYFIFSRGSRRKRRSEQPVSDGGPRSPSFQGKRGGGWFDRGPRGSLNNAENGPDEWTNGRMDERSNAQSLDLEGLWDSGELIRLLDRDSGGGGVRGIRRGLRLRLDSATGSQSINRDPGQRCWIGQSSSPPLSLSLSPSLSPPPSPSLAGKKLGWTEASKYRGGEKTPEPLPNCGANAGHKPPPGNTPHLSEGGPYRYMSTLSTYVNAHVHTHMSLRTRAQNRLRTTYMYVHCSDFSI